MATSNILTTREVARLCRVSDATVKRWHDAGLLKSERTSGGHRRFCAEEVCRFQREQGLGFKVSHGDESNQISASRRYSKKKFDRCAQLEKGSLSSEFFHAIVAGQEVEAANLMIGEFINHGKLAEIFDVTISEAMGAVGDLWLMGELSVAQEHLASRTTINALHRLRSVVPVAESNQKLAFCCAVEGDLHELPPYLAQLILERQGFEVINYGANSPLFSISDEISRYSPSLICISMTTSEDIERASRDYRDFYSKANN